MSRLGSGRRSKYGVDERITHSVPAGLNETQSQLLTSILPDPTEEILTRVLCKRCGEPVATIRRILGSDVCPLMFIGTMKSADLIEYDKSRPEPRRHMTSVSTYSAALGHPSTPASLPLRCEDHGDLTVAALDIMRHLRSSNPRRPIRV